MIKEEVILYNTTTSKILCYCVLVERASSTFGDCIKTWLHPKKRDEKREWFSP
jgi:hypothetical protein